MLNFKKISLLLLVVPLGSQVYGSAAGKLSDEDDSFAPASAVSQSPVKFEQSGIVYSPETKKFEGEFFDKASDIAHQLAGFYLEKLEKTGKPRLEAAEKEVKEIQSALKITQNEATESIENSLIINLKRELLLAESAVHFYRFKTEKFKRRFETMSKIEEILQLTFYLEMLSLPETYSPGMPYSIISVNRYKAGNGDHVLAQRENISFNLTSLSQIERTVREKEGAFLKKPDFQQWLEATRHLFSILESYLMREGYENKKKIDLYKKYKNASDLETDSQVLKLKKEKIMSKLEDVQFRIDRKIKPLADLCLHFANTLENFQKELQTQAQVGN
jgi:hypothetical protein